MSVYYKFEELGFSKNESRVYLALLDLGNVNLKILERKTNIHRANLLDTLEKLESKGIIGVGFEGKRKFYFPIKPEIVFDRIVKKTEETSNELIKELKTKKRTTESSPVSIFHGREGLNNILDDELETGQTINAIQSSKNVEELSGSYLRISREKRWRKGMKMRVLYEKSDENYSKEIKKVPNTEVKIADSGLGPVTLDVYGNRAVLIFGKEPTIIRIINQDVASSFLKLFEMMWKKGEKL